MKFDVVVGNPPYQETNYNNNRDESIYSNFYDLAKNIGLSYTLISPARFLFNVGATNSNWNNDMLSDEHLAVLYFSQNSNDIFPNTDIKGGVAVLYRDVNKTIGPIGVFTAFPQLHSILNKVLILNESNIATILYTNSSYKLSDVVYDDHPDLLDRVTSQEKRAVGSNIFSKLPELFSTSIDDAHTIGLYGRYSGERVYKYINKDYLNGVDNLNSYKVFIPGANGSGAIGEVLSTPVIGTPVIGTPGIGHTQTFISIGNFDTKFEAEALLSYLKCKFSRAMLGIKKVTQNNKTKETWSTVPLQDFTLDSDIDWTKSIAEIDQQLYAKYDLSNDEIAFIEEKVKPMA